MNTSSAPDLTALAKECTDAWNAHECDPDNPIILERYERARYKYDEASDTTGTTAPPLPTLTIVDGPDWHSGNDGDTDAPGWNHEHHAYRVTLTGHDGMTMSRIPWRQGVGITDDPEAHDVLGCLLSDAQGIEACTGFPDWAESYGLNPDSIRDRDTYCLASEQTDGLAYLLTRPVMVALMDDEDSTYGDAEHFAAAWARVDWEAVAARAAR